MLLFSPVLWVSLGFWSSKNHWLLFSLLVANLYLQNWAVIHDKVINVAEKAWSMYVLIWHERIRGRSSRSPSHVLRVNSYTTGNWLLSLTFLFVSANINIWRCHICNSGIGYAETGRLHSITWLLEIHTLGSSDLLCDSPVRRCRFQEMVSK